MAGTGADLPRWPGKAMRRVCDVRFDISVDRFFELVWQPGSKYTLKCEEVRGDKEAAETSWLDEQALASAVLQPTANAVNTNIKPEECQGKVKKHTCNSVGMGMKYKVDELQRCTEAVPGKRYVLEACVITTATYGDKFRCVLLHTMTADGPQRCHWEVDLAIVYIAYINGIVKGLIERGAINGISKNFEQMCEVMTDFAGGAPAAPAAGPAAQAPPPPPAAASPFSVAQPAWCSCWTEAYVQLWQPVGRILQPLVPSQDEARLAAIPAAMALFLGVNALLQILHILRWACSLGWPTQWLLPLWAFLDLPRSPTGAVAGAALLCAAHAGLMRLVPLLLPVASHAASQAASLAGIRQTVSEEGHDGVRFDGFEAALKTASQEIADTAEDLAKPQRPATGSQLLAARSEAAKDQLKANFMDVKRFMESSWAKLGPQKEEPAVHPPPQSAVEAPKQATPPSAPKPFTPSQHARGHLQPPKSLSPTLPTGHGHFREPSTSGALHTRNSSSGAAAGAEASGTVSPPKVEGRPATAPASELSQRKSGLAGAFASGGVLGKWGINWPDSPMDEPRGSVERAKVPASADSPPVSSPVAAGSPHGARTAGDKRKLHDRDAEVISPQTDLGRCLEEVFEHERISPIFGWGHKYPGHFLPTDRVGHWGLPNGQTVGKDVTDFFDVAPQLAQGWCWEDDDWHIDMAGLESHAVDAEGWSYAVDYPWLTAPPTLGSGRCRKMRDFVRRRVWKRSRITWALAQELAASGAPSAVPPGVPSVVPPEAPSATSRVPPEALPMDPPGNRSGVTAPDGRPYPVGSGQAAAPVAAEAALGQAFPPAPVWDMRSKDAPSNDAPSTNQPAQSALDPAAAAAAAAAAARAEPPSPAQPMKSALKEPVPAPSDPDVNRASPPHGASPPDRRVRLMSLLKRGTSGAASKVARDKPGDLAVQASPKSESAAQAAGGAALQMDSPRSLSCPHEVPLPDEGMLPPVLDVLHDPGLAAAAHSLAEAPCPASPPAPAEVAAPQAAAADLAPLLAKGSSRSDPLGVPAGPGPSSSAAAAGTPDQTKELRGSAERSAIKEGWAATQQWAEQVGASQILQGVLGNRLKGGLPEPAGDQGPPPTVDSHLWQAESQI